MTTTTFPNGSRVNFLPGPKSTARVNATVLRTEGGYLVTKGDDGRERKVRPGTARAA